MGENDIRRERNQFGRVSANVVGIDSSPANVDPQVAADGPAEFLQLLLERAEPCLIFRSVRGCGQEYADAPHPAALLPARRERPRCRAAEQRDELAASDHSITSSARASRVGGISRPSALAVVRLTTRSNFVGCSTGMSAGLVPCRTLSTKSAARRYRSRKFGP